MGFNSGFKELSHLKVVPVVELSCMCDMRVERRDKSEMLVQLSKQNFVLSAVTVGVPEIGCSHIRAVLIYTEALAGSCILWGVKANGLELSIRYDTYKVKGD